MPYRVLVAEDEDITRKHIVHALTAEGCTVESAPDGMAALALAEASGFDLLITDIKMPGMGGIELLRKVREQSPDTDVIVITGFGSIGSAVDAMRGGAYDYIPKPFELDELVLKVSHIRDKRRLERENRAMRVRLGLDRDTPFIARGASMRRVVEVIESIKNSDCNVLLTGESGTGKGLVATIIHRNSPRARNTFLGINCAVFTEELLASELFGHEKGAFTGAVAMKQGLLEVAHGGTVLLDEIAEMAPALQAKLLKAIEDKQFMRVGGTKSVKVDVRFIAATNRDIRLMVAEGKFREDLFYRLNVMDIAMPPLRQRKEDIVHLARHFLDRHAKKIKKNVTGFTDQAMELLTAYTFPGNVRELENIVERAVILEQSHMVTPGSLPQSLHLFQIETVTPANIKTIDQLNREYAEKILELTGNNRSKTAEILGISRTSLWRILKEDQV